MKLTKVRVKNFRSVEDSGEFDVSALTCLVGKNEAGKTAILSALYGLRSFRPFQYEQSRDYPRRYLASFDKRHLDGKSEVVRTWWALDEEDTKAVEEKFGAGVLSSSEIEIWYGINYESKYWNVQTDEQIYLNHVIGKHKLNAAEMAGVKTAKDIKSAIASLNSSDSLTDKQRAVLAEIESLRESRLSLAVIDLLNERMPKFFYTSHYERMSGEISPAKLVSDKDNGNVSIGDQIFLDFLEYAGTSVEELEEATKYEDLKAKCEGASNEITDEIFTFWSQSEALSVQIERGEGKPDDPPPFNQGAVFKIRIFNNHHRASIPLSDRSAGFVWFFSFLAQFKQLRKTAGSLILLLDEPGLTLHGKAQEDLLRYIQERLLPEHQVIYTTHSPFMVPADRLVDVRIIEDVVDKDDRGRPMVRGTKVSSEIMSVDKDTLFPLQGHLGYEITQSLFIGKNTLLVEGPSDILYLQSLSEALLRKRKRGLDRRWTICPSGGIDKIMPFASLFGGNNLNIAVLCDMAHGHKAKVQRLKESEILKINQVFTISDFTDKPEGDVEDLLDREFYCDLVNAAYELPDQLQLKVDNLDNSGESEHRIVKQVEAAFKVMPPEMPEFSHFTPSDFLLRNSYLLDADSKQVNKTLEMAEKVITALNELLK